MPERPLVMFPRPEPVDRPKGHGGGSHPPAPTDTMGQAQRIEQQFADIQAAFVSSTPGDIERVLVIESTNQIDGLRNAVEKIQGLEWLAEIDVDDIELHDLYDEQTGKKVKGGRFYILSSNKQAVDRLLGLWKRYRSDKKQDRGYGKFSDVFKYLLTLRLWNIQDRIRDTGILKEWQSDYEAKQGTHSQAEFEIELHYRFSNEKRDRNFDDVEQKVESIGGSIGQTCHIANIAFHAMKVTLPISSIEEILKHDWNEAVPTGDFPALFRCDAIKYVRPTGQHIGSEAPSVEEPFDKGIIPVENKPPALALLDGAPILRHALLNDRIVFDDPDGYMSDYQPSEQKHGTAMASLICHGDLGPETDIKSLLRPIYARPVMKPHPISREEQIPSGRFQEDLIEIAVTNLFSENSPDTHGIRVINISLGNLDQQYINEMSPWARLLDWLSFRHKVLFIVSAGNYSDSIRLIGAANNNVRARLINGIDKNHRNHRLLSPAESINALTVGGVQGDASGSLPQNVRGSDPVNNMELPSPYSRIGPGYRGAVKPEIYTQGGRLLYDADPTNSDILTPVSSNRLPGVRVANPSTPPGNLTNTAYQAGTSHAAAITSHAAGHIYEMLDELRAEHGEFPNSDFDAVLIKALLVHSASQGQNGGSYQHLKNSTNKMKFKRYISRYIGYGNIHLQRVLECTRTRATAVGYGNIKEKERHRFAFPLPVGTDVNDYLRLTITLAWFSPVNPSHIGWRRAKLFIKGEKLKDQHERQESDWQQVRKGTVQHEIFKLNKNDLPGTNLELFVECASDAGALDDEIPYGIAVTLEVAENESIDLYQIIRDNIRPQVQVTGAGA